MSQTQIEEEELDAGEQTTSGRLRDQVCRVALEPAGPTHVTQKLVETLGAAGHVCGLGRGMKKSVPMLRGVGNARRGRLKPTPTSRKTRFKGGTTVQPKNYVTIMCQSSTLRAGGVDSSCIGPLLRDMPLRRGFLQEGPGEEGREKFPQRRCARRRRSRGANDMKPENIQEGWGEQEGRMGAKGESPTFR